MIRPGSIVRPTAGQDQDRYFVVQSVEGCWVQLSDGRKRKLEHPKRKKAVPHTRDRSGFGSCGDDQ